MDSETYNWALSFGFSDEEAIQFAIERGTSQELALPDTNQDDPSDILPSYQFATLPSVEGDTVPETSNEDLDFQEPYTTQADAYKTSTEPRLAPQQTSQYPDLQDDLQYGYQRTVDHLPLDHEVQYSQRGASHRLDLNYGQQLAQQRLPLSSPSSHEAYFGQPSTSQTSTLEIEPQFDLQGASQYSGLILQEHLGQEQTYRYPAFQHEWQLDRQRVSQLPSTHHDLQRDLHRTSQYRPWSDKQENLFESYSSNESFSTYANNTTRFSSFNHNSQVSQSQNSSLAESSHHQSRNEEHQLDLSIPPLPTLQRNIPDYEFIPSTYSRALPYLPDRFEDVLRRSRAAPVSSYSLQPSRNLQSSSAEHIPLYKSRPSANLRSSSHTWDTSFVPSNAQTPHSTPKSHRLVQASTPTSNNDGHSSRADSNTGDNNTTIPDTYQGRRTAAAREHFQHECKLCKRRYLYLNSAQKHWRQRHNDQGAPQINSAPCSTKRPPPAKPRNAAAALARARREGGGGGARKVKMEEDAVATTPTPQPPSPPVHHHPTVVQLSPNPLTTAMASQRPLPPYPLTPTPLTVPSTNDLPTSPPTLSLSLPPQFTPPPLTAPTHIERLRAQIADGTIPEPLPPREVYDDWDATLTWVEGFGRWYRRCRMRRWAGAGAGAGKWEWEWWDGEGMLWRVD